MKRTMTLPPDPARLVEGLRDTGYDFDMALADIADNSLDANASTISINIALDLGGEVSVWVADDGCGMNEAELENAMKYGSESKKDPSSLGKFGLGLKTASTAFCRKFSVISRATDTAPFLKAIWDLDHIVEKHEWELLWEDPSKEEIEILNKIAPKGSSTLVKWEKIDRLLQQYDAPGGRFARNAINKIIDGFIEHIGMVYQRFIDKADTRARDITLLVNGSPVKHWNPFCNDEKGTELVAQENMACKLPDGTKSTFAIKAYILPRPEEFSSPGAAKKAKITNDNQGIYVYRENRLIMPATWMQMFRKEPHLSLLRVEFSFYHELDLGFNVDIKKSRIALNEELFQWLQKFLTAPRNAADERSRKGQKKDIADAAETAHDSSNAAIGAKEKELIMAGVKIINESANEAEVTNKYGVFRIKLPISKPSKNGQVFVEPAEGINDGLLWEPCIIDMHHGIRINTGHPYYHKVYTPNLQSGVTIQGMDSLLWALCEAELGTMNAETRKYFNVLRYEVSRLLRELVDDMPEPDLENGS